jgi:hypothetical protein
VPFRVSTPLFPGVRYTGSTRRQRPGESSGCAALLRPGGRVGSGVNSLTLGPYDCLGRLASAGQRPAVHNTRLPLPPSASVEMEVKARTRCLLGRM